ncbi:MAG: NUDIX hydrolase [Opitutaceae bacterium]|nr:NUDIX hydrolase [Opitutaceae bacterium]
MDTVKNPDSGSLPAWTRGATRVLAKTRILELWGVRFSHPAREESGEFSVIHTRDWVNIVATTPDHRMVLVRQFRYGINAPSLEIPGGIIEEGEDPIQAGLRELREETGFVGTGARLLGSIHPNPAIQDNRCHLIWVEKATLQEQTAWDEHEELETLTLPIDEAYRQARIGGITHSLVLNGLFLFEPHWAALRPELR